MPTPMQNSRLFKSIIRNQFDVMVAIHRLLQSENSSMTKMKPAKIKETEHVTAKPEDFRFRLMFSASVNRFIIL